MVRSLQLKPKRPSMMLPGWKRKAGSSLPQALLCLLLLTMALVSPWALKRVVVEAQVVTVFTGVQHKLLALEVTFPEALGLGFRLLVTILLVMTDKRFLDPLFQLFEDSA